jgi:hypothetical protein
VDATERSTRESFMTTLSRGGEARNGTLRGLGEQKVGFMVVETYLFYQVFKGENCRRVGGGEELVAEGATKRQKVQASVVENV